MKTNILILMTLLILPVILFAKGEPETKNSIEVFYKQRKPSLKTLEKTKEILNTFQGDYTIRYFLITDPESSELIKKYLLPETHFPFAIVINGKYSAMIEDKKVYFLEFPLFMKGIGRHEGNWSLDDLEMVLKDNSLLIKENTLPVSLGEHHDDEPCPGESTEAK